MCTGLAAPQWLCLPRVSNSLNHHMSRDTCFREVWEVASLITLAPLYLQQVVANSNPLYGFDDSRVFLWRASYIRLRARAFLEAGRLEEKHDVQSFVLRRVRVQAPRKDAHWCRNCFYKWLATRYWRAKPQTCHLPCCDSVRVRASFHAGKLAHSKQVSIQLTRVLCCLPFRCFSGLCQKSKASLPCIAVWTKRSLVVESGFSLFVLWHCLGVIFDHVYLILRARHSLIPSTNWVSLDTIHCPGPRQNWYNVQHCSTIFG